MVGKSEHVRSEAMWKCNFKHFSFYMFESIYMICYWSVGCHIRNTTVTKFLTIVVYWFIHTYVLEYSEDANV